MSHDHNACCCGGGDERGHLVDCPAPTLIDRRVRLPVSSHVRLIAAARVVWMLCPLDWERETDPDQIAAWSALEEALRASGGLP